ncbi:cysteinyl-tRNA ligase [Listeria floridensis FSL S10-1187]|uniref:Cysteine--tRNA ligase n=1 Tax=Listeria floridensis FSL S10-1187 TaxID=1265817 RepID=A0ABP3B4E8_9LIST|nr:cysteine--tRNA ligase [Listeria floridensis]EUJ33852.1 cysteinyl-tRNA ligase [Listeria floridensis FSL S10-1187]
MSLQIYNTLTREKEVFKPIEDGKVKMYVCGPTVYNYIHIGNARPIIVFDTVRRYLTYRGYDVNFVSNFTDVDDKLIRAAEELKLTVPEVADKFIGAYFDDVDQLNVAKATVNPRVTENMDEIIEFIKALVDKGFAYESQGDVYYRTRKFEGYGKLSHQPIEDLRHGARVETNDLKEEQLDFALWKKAKPGEIYWESPFGNGRPGWHIECSTLARKYLGDTIDIHAGGQDLIFPHHEDEIAQSEALTGHTFANYWMHNGFLNIDGEKMSKSLGNFITLHDVLQDTDPNVVRFFMLSVHYRRPISLSDATLEDAANGLERLETAYQNLKYRIEMLEEDYMEAEHQEEWLEQLTELKMQFEDEMDDDFNTANAITAFYELAKRANIYLARDRVSVSVLREFLSMMQLFAEVLGIKLEKTAVDGLADEEIDDLIEERLKARNERNFARADEIRDLLKEKDIILEDTAHGTRWKRG